MASIRTAIELQDNFSAPMYAIQSSMNATMSVAQDFSSTMGSSINTNNLEQATEVIDDTTSALNELNAAAENAGSQDIIYAPVEPVIPSPLIENPEPIIPEIQPNAPPTVQVPIEWEGTDSAMSDLTNLGTRIDSIQSKIQEIENDPINFGSDVASSELESLRSQLSVILDTQEDLNKAVDNMDVSDANIAYLKLNSNVSATEMYIRDNASAQDTFNTSANSSVSIFRKLASFAAAIGIGIAITQASSAIYTAATDLEATEAKFETVFEGYEDVAQGIVDEFQVLTAATESSTRSMVSGIQDLLVPMGYTKDAATEMTGETMTLVGALTNFNSATHSAEDVASAFQSALTGEYESLKALGIQLDVTTVQEQVLAMGLADTTDEITTQMEAQAMLALAYEQSTDALAAYNEESLDTTTRMGILSASFTDTFAEAGQSLLPLINVILIQIQNNFGTIEALIYGFANALSGVIAIASILFDVIMAVTNFMIENWSIISPIIYGIVTALAAYLVALIAYSVIQGITAAVTAIHTAVTAAQTGATFAATAAQYGFNTALLACPLTWIIIAIIAIIALLVMLCNWIASATGAAESGIGIIAGSLMTAVAFIGNIFVALINMVIDIFVVLWNFIASFANFFGNVFTDPVGSIARLFFDLVDCVLALLETLASAIDTLFGSDLAGSVSGWRDSLSGWVDDTFGQGEEIMAEISGESLHVSAFDYGDAWDAGTSFGDSIASSISDFSLSDLIDTSDITTSDDYSSSAYDTSDVSDIASSTDDIAGSTSDISDSLDATEEDLQYLRDIAEAEAINRFTTAEVTINQSNTNNINTDDDIDGFMTKLTDAVNEAVEIVSGKGD